MSPAPLPSPAPERDIFGQPRALFGVFWTEMFERFSFYGARAILLYYIVSTALEGGLGLDETSGMAIVSIFGACTYLFGVVGGFLADHLVSAAKLVLFGGLFIASGNIIIGLFPSVAGLLAGLFIIIIGTGLLKPNVTHMVGEIYRSDDPRRDTGFSILYMSINFGSLISPLVVGFVGQEVSYRLAFFITGGFMVLGILVFVTLKRLLAQNIGTSVPNPLPPQQLRSLAWKVGLALGISAVALLILALLGQLNLNAITGLISLLIVAIATLYLVRVLSSPKITHTERKRMFTFIPFFLVAIYFYAIDEQLSSVIAEWTADKIDLHFAGMEIPASWIQSVNPLLVILLTPLVVWVTIKIGGIRKGLRASTKFTFGVLFGALSYGLIAAIELLLPQALYPIFVPVLIILILTVGEILITPVGLSVSTKLAPAAFSTQMIGIWFLADSTGQAINAQITRFYDPQNNTGFFLIFAVIGIIIALLLHIFHHKIDDLME